MGSLCLVPSPASAISNYRKHIRELEADVEKRREQMRATRKRVREYRARVKQAIRSEHISQESAQRDARLLAEAKATLSYILDRWRETEQLLLEWQIRIAKAHAAEAEARGLS